jgi:hypothetical protein
MPSDTYETDDTNGNGDQTYRYGDDISLPFSDIPVSMLRLGFTRAMSHVLGNEVAAKVLSMGNKMEANGEFTSEEARKQWAAEKTLELRQDYIESVKAGTWGSGTRGPSGPRVDPLETEYDRVIADATRAYLRDAVKGKQIAYDKGAKHWFWQVDGQLQTRTIEEAIESFESKQSPEKLAKFREAAAEMVQVKRRRAEAAKESAAATPFSL